MLLLEMLVTPVARPQGSRYTFAPINDQHPHGKLTHDT
jgi:hypothetical protein